VAAGINRTWPESPAKRRQAGCNSSGRKDGHPRGEAILSLRRELSTDSNR